jgi:hypothetical protein
MQTPVALIELSNYVPPDVVAAILSAIAAILGWIFGRKTKISQD